MITVTNTNHTHAQEYASYGGVGGYSFQPETTTVEWSDGTRLIVEGYYAVATYKGTSYKLNSTANISYFIGFSVIIGH